MFLWSWIATFIEAIANMGAGMASTSLGYEPELPEELQKQKQFHHPEVCLN